MNRRTWIWALGALIACMGLVTDSHAALLAGFNAKSAAVAVPVGGTVQLDYAVFTKNGDGTYTGNAAVDAAFAGGGDYLYLYQITSNLQTISQTLTTTINPIDFGPVAVADVELNGNTGVVSNLGANSTRVTTVNYDNFVFSLSSSSSGSNPIRLKTAVFGYTSSNPPKIVGEMSVQKDTNGGSVQFAVPVPDPDLAPSVPEPGTLLMSALALIGGGYAMRRRVVA